MGFTQNTCEEFVEVLASKAPVPGGGGASALVGAVGMALGNMVGSLTVGKKKYADVEGIQLGQDWWHVFEISWLNAEGVPQVAIGRISLPASSPNLIESKSLKLYFNSMNFTRFQSPANFIETVEHDLTAAAEAPVTLLKRASFAPSTGTLVQSLVVSPTS